MPDEWFVRRGEVERGPLALSEIERLVARGIIAATDLIRNSDQPEWREVGTVEALFPLESPAKAVPPPLPLPSAIPQSPTSSSPPKSANAVEKVQAGLADILSTAKQAKDLASAHARKTHITQMTLPKAYLTLGKDVFEDGRFRDQFTELFQHITATNDEIAKVAATNSQRPQATDLKGKLQSGAANLVAQGQSAKLTMQRDSLLKQIGKRAFELHGTSAGSPELLTPITSANDEIARLNAQIGELSSGDKGPLWQRLPLAALLTVVCWPIGILLVWLNPKLSRRSKVIWTGGGIAAFVLLAAIVPKSKNDTSQVASLTPQSADIHQTSVSPKEQTQKGQLAPTVSTTLQPKNGSSASHLSATPPAEIQKSSISRIDKSIPRSGPNGEKILKEDNGKDRSFYYYINKNGEKVMHGPGQGVYNGGFGEKYEYRYENDVLVYRFIYGDKGLPKETFARLPDGTYERDEFLPLSNGSTVQMQSIMSITTNDKGEDWQVIKKRRIVANNTPLPPVSGRNLKVSVGTAIVQDTGMAQIVKQHNASLSAVKCVATADHLVIDFDVDGSQWNAVNRKFPILVRLFDRNGQYLTHFTTAEGFTVHYEIYETYKEGYAFFKKRGDKMMAAQRMCEFLKPKGNRIVYNVNIRDLQVASAIEIGFAEPERILH